MFSWYVFLYFIALITEEGFRISPCYSLELCIQMGISFFSPLLFTSLLFTAICKASWDNYFAFLPFISFWMVLIPAVCTVLWTSAHSSSGTLSIRSNLLNLIITSIVYSEGIWFMLYPNGLVVFPTFINLSLNFAIRSSWSEPQSAPGLVFCWLYLHL